MEARSIAMTRERAGELLRQYRKDLHYSTPVDREVMRAYALIAKGRLIIRAIEAVGRAGLKDDGSPKLAIVRADAAKVEATVYVDGSARMMHPKWRGSNREIQLVTAFPRGTFAVGPNRSGFHGEAIVPLIPLPLRPRRAIESYHVLWEAEWTKRVPVDPMLLRRIGRTDLWLVVAQWDLTEIEQAVLSTRIANA